MTSLLDRRLLFVTGKGGVGKTTIAAALRLARPGDTVIVTGGVYREPRLDVTVPVTILGRGEAILDGGGAHEVLTTIMLNFVIRALMLGVGAHFFIRESVHTAPIAAAAHLPRLSSFFAAVHGSAANLAGAGRAVRLVPGSVLDREHLEEVLAGADAVVHLAARPSVTRALQDPVTSHHVTPAAM